MGTIVGSMQYRVALSRAERERSPPTRTHICLRTYGRQRGVLVVAMTVVVVLSRGQKASPRAGEESVL